MLIPATVLSQRPALRAFAKLYMRVLFCCLTRSFGSWRRNDLAGEWKQSSRMVGTVTAQRPQAKMAGRRMAVEVKGGNIRLSD